MISKFIGYENNNIYAEEVKYDKAANKDTLKELSDRLSYDDKNLYRDGDIIYKLEGRLSNLEIEMLKLNINNLYLINKR